MFGHSRAPKNKKYHILTISPVLGKLAYICLWRWNQKSLSLKSQSITDKVIGWAVLALVCERTLLVSTDYNLTRSYVSQKVFSSSMNPSQNPGFIQAAKEFFGKFKDCANVILGKESTANKQWTREKCFYTERKSFILLYFYSKNH